jgi:O-antigen ligase
MVTPKTHTHPLFSSTMRLGYWKDTLGVIKSSPLTGVGLGNFNLPQSRYAHNSYLQIWAEMGLLGIFAFLWLILFVFKSAHKKIRQSLKPKEEAALGAASVAFLVHNFMDFGFFLPEVSLIWWVIMGLLVSPAPER